MIKSIHLQGIGRFQAKKASEFKVGDKLVWNGGFTSKITKIKKKTPSQIVFEVKSDGKLYDKRINKDRLVAYTK